jgi:hypothetical protein
VACKIVYRPLHGLQDDPKSTEMSSTHTYKYDALDREDGELVFRPAKRRLCRATAMAFAFALTIFFALLGLSKYEYMLSSVYPILRYAGLSSLLRNLATQSNMASNAPPESRASGASIPPTTVSRQRYLLMFQSTARLRLPPPCLDTVRETRLLLRRTCTASWFHA